MPPTSRAKTSRSVRTPTSRPESVADEDRIARPGALDRPDALGQRGARQDGHGLAPAEHAETLLGDGRDAARDGGFGGLGHALKCSASCAKRACARSGVGPPATRRPTDGPVGAASLPGMDRRRALGIGLVVVAGASFASGSIFATLSYGEGLDWLTLLGWRFLIGAGLAWAWVALSPSRRGVRPRAVASPAGGDAGPRRGLHGQRRDVLRRDRDHPGVARRRDRVHLPGLRRPAVASVRHAAAGPATMVRAGPGGDRHRPGARRRRRQHRPADPGHPPDPCVSGDLLGLDRPVRAPVGRTARPARERHARRRPGGQGRRRHDRGDDERDGRRVRRDGRGRGPATRPARRSRPPPGRTCSGSASSPRSWPSRRCTPGLVGSGRRRPRWSARPSRSSSSCSRSWSSISDSPRSSCSGPGSSWSA